MIIALLYHTRFKIPLVFACLYILFFKYLVFLEEGMLMSKKTRLHKSRSSRYELEFDLSNFV